MTTYSSHVLSDVNGWIFLNKLQLQQRHILPNTPQTEGDMLADIYAWVLQSVLGRHDILKWLYIVSVQSTSESGFYLRRNVKTVAEQLTRRHTSKRTFLYFPFNYNVIVMNTWFCRQLLLIQFLQRCICDGTL